MLNKNISAIVASTGFFAKEFSLGL